MKTLREAQQGRTLLRLLEVSIGYAGVAIAGGKMASRINGADADEVWSRLLRDAGRADPGYIGYDKARRRFLHWFPGGFASDAYVAAERTYKLAARDKLLEEAPVAEVANGSGFAEAAIRAFNRTNLVYPAEKARVRDVLRGSSGDAFLQAAAASRLTRMPRRWR